MSARDLASLRAAAQSPPLPPPGELPGDDVLPESPLLGTSLLGAFERDKAAAVNWRNIPPGTGEKYRRVIVESSGLSEAESSAAELLREAITLRERWTYAPSKPEWHKGPSLVELTASAESKEPTPPPPYHPFAPELPAKSERQFSWKDGLVVVEGDKGASGSSSSEDDSRFDDFVEDLEKLMRTVNDPECRTYCWKRLNFMTEMFNMYITLNGDQEQLSQKLFPHRDFYNCIKVDTHVHHTSCANQKHFLRFIKSKLKKHSSDVVLQNRDDPNGPPLTLKEVFESIDLSAEHLSIDTLDVHAGSGHALFQRFDRFNLKYNPLGQSRLREVFLKTDNYMAGKYLGELTQQVLADQEALKYQLAEYRISVYGKSSSEWGKLATWFHNHEIFSRGTRWLVQIPRLYSSYAEKGLVCNFSEFLQNIFTPMFEATLEPQAHPRIFALLQQMVGVDSVDDESLPPPKKPLRDCPRPEDWTSTENPPYAYYQFYIQENLVTLNRLRESRGLNTLAYRPHTGEAGPYEHLACSFLLANGINHGLKLKESPVLQYLYYLCQIGIAMSPIGNSALFIEYSKNPAHEYFLRGLNISLSTDDPLQFAMTREPLMEEYSVFACVNRCSNTDLCELARNSVLQSGFEPCIKRQWLGDNYYLAGGAGNNPSKTNVPKMRLQYRHDTLVNELSTLWEGAIPRDLRCLPTWRQRQRSAAASADGLPLRRAPSRHL